MDASRITDLYRKYFSAPPASENPGTPGQPGPGTVAVAKPKGNLPPLKWLVVGLVVFFFGLQWMGRSMSKSPSPAADLTDRAPAATTKSTLERLGISVPAGTSGDAALAAREAQIRAQAAARDAQTAELLRTQQGGATTASGQLTPAETEALERKRKDEESLLTSTLIPIAQAEAGSAPVPALSTGVTPVTPAEPSPIAETRPVPAVEPVAPVVPVENKDCVDTVANGHASYALCEGSIVPAVLDNRIVGEFAGPAKAYVMYDVYSKDKSKVILPRGTVVLGEAKPVSSKDQRRMSVSFHRLILPDGRGVALDQMLALDQAGETALSGKVNRHLVSTFGTAAVMGALAGFSQFGSGSAYTGGGIDSYRQGVASGVSQQGTQILQRDLQRLPTITIPEGKAIQIYISADLHLPEYVPSSMLAKGKK